MSALDEQLTNPATFSDDSFYDLLATMRRDHPVYWTTGKNGAGFWSLIKIPAASSGVLSSFARFASRKNYSQQAAGN